MFNKIGIKMLKTFSLGYSRFKNFLHSLKEWVESFAHRPSAGIALFIFAFVESSFFPIPPDALLIILAISYPRRSFYYALICTIGSVLGSYLGYLIGYVFYDTIGIKIIKFYGVEHQINYVLQKYQENGFIAIVTAGFTPIPYKVFTILAGFNKTIDLFTLTFASIVGRAGRFFLVGGLIYFIGPGVKTFIDKYLDKLTIAFMFLLVISFFVLKYLV